MLEIVHDIALTIRRAVVRRKHEAVSVAPSARECFLPLLRKFGRRMSWLAARAPSSKSFSKPLAFGAGTPSHGRPCADRSPNVNDGSTS